MNILSEKLKKVVEERRAEGTSELAIINAIKEDLQYPVLDFVYNSPKYSHLIMYGGTFLRIAYGLPRMSEDLDFQTEKNFDFNKFKTALKNYFKSNFGVEIDMKVKTERSSGTDMAFIEFPNILEEIGLKGHGIFTKLKLRFDVNRFEDADKFETELVPISKDFFAFSIRTYPISTLMASKIGAFLLRGKRGIGADISDCKPRDIFDIMWYMEKKIIPNMDYLKAIHKRINQELLSNTIIDLFDLITGKIINLKDKSFSNDLSLLFYNQNDYASWTRNWKERFRILRNSYEIFEIKQIKNKPAIKEIKVLRDFASENTFFHFIFETVESLSQNILFTISISENWYRYKDFKIAIGNRVQRIEKTIQNFESLNELDKEFVGLFYKKIEDYIKRNNYIILNSQIKTKLIRSSASNLNIKTQVFVDSRSLISNKLEDLL